MNVSPEQDELPLLTYDVVRSIREFPGFTMTVTEQDVEDYLAITGTSSPPGIVPPGYAAVFGRLGYLRRHRMPGGGVLLGQEITWHHPAVVGEPIQVRAVVESTDEDEKGRRKVVLVTTATQRDERAATVRITAGWPS